MFISKNWCTTPTLDDRETYYRRSRTLWPSESLQADVNFCLFLIDRLTQYTTMIVATVTPTRQIWETAAPALLSRTTSRNTASQKNYWDSQLLWGWHYPAAWNVEAEKCFGQITRFERSEAVDHIQFMCNEHRWGRSWAKILSSKTIGTDVKPMGHVLRRILSPYLVAGTVIPSLRQREKAFELFAR